MKPPKVSVAMISYNHARFVEQALKSVLTQETDFEWEIVFGEDCSTDGTRELVQQIAAANPERIRLLLPEKNLGMLRNFATTIEACRGEYIALLEGDDFWLDSSKLQQQVNLLDAHPEFSTCFCPVRTVDENGATLPSPSPLRTVRASYSLAQFLAGEFRPRTCTVMYRRGLFDRFPEWFFDLPGGDYPLHVLNGQHGDFGLINAEMVAYRVHSGGIWTQGISEAEWDKAPEALQIKRLTEILTLQRTALRVLGRSYEPILRRQIVGSTFRLATCYWRIGDWRNMRRAMWKALGAKPWGTSHSFAWIVQAMLVCHFPFLSRHKARARSDGKR